MNIILQDQYIEEVHHIHNALVLIPFLTFDVFVFEEVWHFEIKDPFLRNQPRNFFFFLKNVP
jgi:hypothetical protein